MKRLIAVLAVLFVIAMPAALAADSELTVSGSHNDTEGVFKSTTISGELLAPLGRILVGPTIEWMDLSIDLPSLPPGQERRITRTDADGVGLGVALEWNITGETFVPYIGASATYWRGDFGDLFNYSAHARAGVKVGSDTTFLKVQYAVGKDYGDGAVPDRDRDQAFVGFGKRF